MCTSSTLHTPYICSAHQLCYTYLCYYINSAGALSAQRASIVLLVCYVNDRVVVVHAPVSLVFFVMCARVCVQCSTTIVAAAA